MVLEACCKINLGLRIVRKREDGYHELQTVMYHVRGLYDVVEVEAMQGEGVEFVGRGIVVDCPAEKNLCVRAARLMQERYGVGGVRITLDKRVPFGAGLGGGSSDATAVIVAINEIFGLGQERATLAALAAELGSDTPFFVYDEPQYCTSRGEVMEPATVDLHGLWLAVVKPQEGVSTAEAYSGVKPCVPNDDLRELLQDSVDRWQGSVLNDFEGHILAAHSRIAEIKQTLMDSGAVYASMSGSGSAVFGLFKARPELTFGDDEFVHIEYIN
ncbi:MAG: 4-(cytidine 5'-diphospho)-2-C-methyl-D-erythritol kinase [Alistipes sp.]|nr:4-(cytidine 5'-diphospho)-2-C-methyl-D-erythritol kinase [Alistipes sp.]